MKRVIEIKAGDVTVRAAFKTSPLNPLSRCEVETVLNQLADGLMNVCASLKFGCGAVLSSQRVKK